MAKGIPLTSETRADARGLKKAGLTNREIANLLEIHHTTVQLNTRDLNENRATHRGATERAAAATIIDLRKDRTRWQTLARQKSGKNYKLNLEAFATEESNERLKRQCWEWKNKTDAARNEAQDIEAERDALKCDVDKLEGEIRDLVGESHKTDAVFDWVTERYEGALRSSGRSDGYTRRGVTKVEAQLNPTQHYHAGIGWVDSEDCELAHSESSTLPDCAPAWTYFFEAKQNV